MAQPLHGQLGDPQLGGGSATSSLPLSAQLGWILLAASGCTFGYAAIRIFGDVVHAWQTAHKLEAADAIGGTVFAIVSIGVLCATVMGRRNSIERRALQLRNPERPWLWRRAWLESRIESDGRARQIGLWGFTLLWNLMSLPVWLRMAGPAILFAWIFPLAGLVMLFVAVRSSLREARNGRSVLVLQSMPGVLGGQIAGEIHAVGSLSNVREFQVRISCVRRLTKDRRDELWQDERTVLASATLSTGAGAMLPFSFTIPYALPASKDNQVTWHIEVSGRRSGPDYHKCFEVPVFETDASSPEVDERAAAPPAEPLPMPQPRSEPESVSEDSSIRVAHRAGGIEIVFPAFRHPLASLILFGAWLFWNFIGLLFMIGWDGWSGIPPKVLIVGGSLFLTWGLLDSIFGWVRLRATTGRLERTHRWLFVGYTHGLEAAEIESVELRHAGRLGRTDLYDLMARRGNSRKRVMARAIRGKRLAVSLRDRIESALSGAG